MTLSLAERLEEARRQQFVGRAAEQEMIREALTAVTPPFVLLYVFGPGGVGKTSLLRSAAHMAKQAGVRVFTLDGRNLESSPAGFLHVLQQQLDSPSPETIFSTLAEANGRSLLLVDTAELLRPLDGWLRDSFLPQLPDNVLNHHRQPQSALPALAHRPRLAAIDAGAAPA